jgi:hypothetical protein
MPGRPAAGRLGDVTRRGNAAGTTVVTLRLDLGTDPISGTLANQHGSERPFWGWLELSGALDELRGAYGGPEARAMPEELVPPP